MSTEVSIADKAIENIPAMPMVASRIMEQVSQEDVQLSQLAKLIESDPAMTARFLQIANSPLYGFVRKINSLSDALPLMGIMAIKSLVITTVMKNIYKNPGLMENLMWEHSIGTGLAARFIAQKIGNVDPEVAFSAGLLHDIGKNVIYNIDRLGYLKFYQQAYNDGLTGDEYVNAEDATFGFNHLTMGAEVCNKWNLSDDLSECLTRHHIPSMDVIESADEPKLLAVVGEANLFTHFLGIGVKEAELNAPLLDNHAAVYLKLNASEVQTWIDEFDRFYEYQKVYFQME